MSAAAGVPARLAKPNRLVLRWARATDRFLGLFGWAIDLALRLWLAQSFLMTAMSRMMGEAPEFGWRSVGWLNDAAGAVEAMAPALIAVGLLTRPAALLLLIVVCAPFLLGQSTFEHIRASVLLWYVLAGAGAVSLDALLRRGMRHAALPLAGAVTRLADGGRVVAGTAFLAGLRLWVAWSLLSFFGLGADPLHLLLALLCAALAVGLATRPVALALVVLPFLLPGMVDAMAGYPTFPLALLVMTGAGRWSADRALVGWLRARRARTLAGDVPRVVILGAGFAGVAAALKLRYAPCRVTIVDRRNHHLFQPLLYQVATGALSPADIATPIREVFREQENVEVLLDEVERVDDDARRVHLASGASLPYDQLVVATGSRTSYFGRDEWAEAALGLKDVDDATAMRRRILSAFEWAEAAETPAERERLLTFVVVGGGPTGVELAGAIAELARFGLPGGYRRIDPAAARIVLVQGADRLLPPFPPELSERTAGDLRRLGVELRLSTRFNGFEADGVRLGDEVLPTASVFWAAGVQASPAARWLGVEPADRGGRIAVEPDLSLPGRPHVFVAGDVAASDAWDGKSVPGLAASAKVMGEHVGRVLLARVEGRREPGAFHYKHLGSLATIGRDAAVADFAPRWRFTGSLAWWLWGAVHILLLTGTRNRLSVAVDWLWAYLTFRQGTLLITGREPPRAPTRAAQDAQPTRTAEVA